MNIIAGDRPFLDVTAYNLYRMCRTMTPDELKARIPGLHSIKFLGRTRDGYYATSTLSHEVFDFPDLNHHFTKDVLLELDGYDAYQQPIHRYLPDPLRQPKPFLTAIAHDPPPKHTPLASDVDLGRLKHNRSPHPVIGRGKRGATRRKPRYVKISKRKKVKAARVVKRRSHLVERSRREKLGSLFGAAAH